MAGQWAASQPALTPPQVKPRKERRELRIGLMVPGAASLLMMALITWRRTNEQTQTTDTQQESILEPTTTGKT